MLVKSGFEPGRTQGMGTTIFGIPLQELARPLQGDQPHVFIEKYARVAQWLVLEIEAWHAG